MHKKICFMFSTRYYTDQIVQLQKLINFRKKVEIKDILLPRHLISQFISVILESVSRIFFVFIDVCYRYSM